MRMIDLRSDTVTLPSREMMESIIEARLGDDVSREDPTVNSLERLASEIFGTEAALLFPSGTQSNLVALMAHCRHGDEVFMEQESHIYYYEVGGLSAVAGLVPHLIKGRRGVVTPEQVEEAFRGDDIHFPHPGLVEMENTHNRAGGTCWKVNEVAAISHLSRDLGMRTHIDGARIFNAAIALDVDVSDYARQVDSISFCLSKGLAAPVGSMLVGDQEFIERARKLRKMLGGGMRQAGIIAAPGIVALTKMVSRLAEDHRNARTLALGLGSLDSLAIDMDTVQTNIVVVDVSGTGMDSEAFTRLLREAGVLVSTFGRNLVRFVTHYGITEEDIHGVLSTVEDVLRV